MSCVTAVEGIDSIGVCCEKCHVRQIFEMNMLSRAWLSGMLSVIFVCLSNVGAVWMVMTLLYHHTDLKR